MGCVPSDLRFGIAPAFVAIGFLLFLLAELRFPLRRSREPKLRRMGRNLALAGIGLAVFELLQIPVLLPVSKWTMEERIGLLNWLPASGWVRTAAAVLLLDYTLWFWHWISHRVPFFWRFHRVHHVDRDMDASTGLRFHFGELSMAVGFRALQIAAVGADPLSVSVYQVLLFASVLFHHSNTRLPLRLERVLARLIVTPRMHGIHHSNYRNETDTNWSSILSAWDYLHGTIRLDVPQDSISIGVPAFDAPDRVTLGRLLLMPFRRKGDDWKRTDGSASVRREGTSTRARLLP
jgi:sterol desaturase/sphingolipid hydroxylase (fatty acid hydroxylase superfamily)